MQYAINNKQMFSSTVWSVHGELVCHCWKVQLTSVFMCMRKIMHQFNWVWCMIFLSNVFKHLSAPNLCIHCCHHKNKFSSFMSLWIADIEHNRFLTKLDNALFTPARSLKTHLNFNTIQHLQVGPLWGCMPNFIKSINQWLCITIVCNFNWILSLAQNPIYPSRQFQWCELNL